MKDLEMSSPDITPSWNSILEDMCNDPEMSPDELVQLEHAFKALAKHLGDDFPANSVIRQHPLDFPLVHNKAAFPKKWLIWLGNAINLLAEHTNFPAVRRKLRTAKGFRESMNFIRFSYRLAASGWSLEFEPHLKHRKCPDLLCISPKDNEVIVEITALGESKREHREEQGLTRMVLGLAGLASDFVTCGRLIGIPKKSDFDRISKASETFHDQLRSNKSFLTLDVPGLLEISGSPESDRAQVESWAAKRGLAPGNYVCSTTDGKDDLLRRITGKLKKKSTQVSGFTKPGLIAISCSSFTNDGAMIDDRCKHLNAELTRYPDVIGLVIFGSIWRQPRNVYFNLPTHDFIEINGALYESEEWILIHNLNRRESNSITLCHEFCEAFAGQSL